MPLETAVSEKILRFVQLDLLLMLNLFLNFLLRTPALHAFFSENTDTFRFFTSHYGKMFPIILPAFA